MIWTTTYPFSGPLYERAGTHLRQSALTASIHLNTLAGTEEGVTMANKSSSSGSKSTASSGQGKSARPSASQKAAYPQNKPSTTGGKSGGRRSNRSPGQPK